MATERSTAQSHIDYPFQKDYDNLYYKALKPSIKGKVLDMGGGSGMFIREYEDQAESVLSIDKFTGEFFAKAKRLEWTCPELLPKGKFDTIVATEFIEHIERDQLEPLLKQIQSRLKKDGVFVGSTPNKKRPTTNPFHLYEYTLEELRGILEVYFKIQTIEDIGMECLIWKCIQL